MSIVLLFKSVSVWRKRRWSMWLFQWNGCLLLWNMAYNWGWKFVVGPLRRKFESANAGYILSIGLIEQSSKCVWISMLFCQPCRLPLHDRWHVVYSLLQRAKTANLDAVVGIGCHERKTWLSCQMEEKDCITLGIQETFWCDSCSVRLFLPERV